MPPETSGEQTEREMRITPADKQAIKSLFFDNDPGLKVLRKIFLPVVDPNAPIGQVVDLWNVKEIDDMDPIDCKIYFMARSQLIKHVESCILQLSIIAKKEGKTQEQKVEDRKKNSSH